MAKRIAVIDGHPDPSRERYCHRLADAYAEGAETAGHSVKRLTLAEIDIPFLRTSADWTTGVPAAAIRQCQDALAWAEHLVFIYPLWLGCMPALLKAFFEQTLRPGFAIERERTKRWPGLLTGKSARLIVTMGMPAWVYRWYFLAHSLNSLKRNILHVSGIGPVRATLIGSIEAAPLAQRQKWIDKVRGLGRDAT